MTSTRPGSDPIDEQTGDGRASTAGSVLSAARLVCEKDLRMSGGWRMVGIHVVPFAAVVTLVVMAGLLVGSLVAGDGRGLGRLLDDGLGRLLDDGLGRRLGRGGRRAAAGAQAKSQHH